MKNYVEELVADIIANGESELDFASALSRAHERRKAFAAEIAEGSTLRAQVFTRTLMTEVYNSVKSDELMNRNLKVCEEIYNQNN